MFSLFLMGILHSLCPNGSIALGNESVYYYSTIAMIVYALLVHEIWAMLIDFRLD